MASSADMERTSRQLCVAFTVCLASFLLLFGLVLWPNIERTTFARGDCEVVSSTIVPRYACWMTGCDYCSLTSEPFCTTLIGRYEARDPDRCEHDAQQCAPTRAVCTMGPKCCHQTCDTCRSCSTVDGRTSCTSRSCNCRCTIATPFNRCDMACGIKYRVSLSMRHDGGTGVYSRDFGLDKNAAETFLAQWPIGRTAECFYKDTRVELSVDFDTWRIVVFTLFGAAPLFFVCFIATAVMMNDPLGATIIWLGLVLPIIILLPIQQRGAMTVQAAESLTIATWVLFGIFFVSPVTWIICEGVRVSRSQNASAPRERSVNVPRAVPSEVPRAEYVDVVVAEYVDPRAGAAAAAATAAARADEEKQLANT